MAVPLPKCGENAVLSQITFVASMVIVGTGVSTTTESTSGLWVPTVKPGTAGDWVSSASGVVIVTSATVGLCVVSAKTGVTPLSIKEAPVSITSALTNK